MAVLSLRTSKRRATKCCLVTSTYVSIMLLILLIVIFVAIPFIFKYKAAFQRNLIFPIWNIPGHNFSNPKQYNIRGVRNFYVNIHEEYNITLGVWHVLPEDLVDVTLKPEDYEEELMKGEYPVVVFLHGNNNVRTDNVPIYRVLRKYFHVIAYDYRGYGDSTKAELNEDAVVSDSVALYKWLQNRTAANIFIWGHSLGTGIATSTIAQFERTSADIKYPTGLVLEAPFASVIDVVRASAIVKIFSWLPWFESTVIDPFRNGFCFNSTKHILSVNCPVMILHAKDDSVIDITNSEKLLEVSKQFRSRLQGRVTYHFFDAKGYNHMYIHTAPELPSYVENFINECTEFKTFISSVKSF